MGDKGRGFRVWGFRVQGSRRRGGLQRVGLIRALHEGVKVQGLDIRFGGSGSWPGSRALLGLLA